MTTMDDVAPKDLLHGVDFYSLDSDDDSVLSKVCPDHVILYHLDIAFLRKLEVLQV